MAVDESGNTKPKLRIIRSKRVNKKFRTGAAIPTTGIYKVIHAQHRLPHEVTLLENEAFPICSKCGTAVEFELIRAASHIDPHSGFKVRLFSLPVIEESADKPIEEDEDTSAAKAG